jgi:hypothetical protein
MRIRKKFSNRKLSRLLLLLLLLLLVLSTVLAQAVLAQNISKSPLLSQPSADKKNESGLSISPSPTVSIIPKQQEKTKEPEKSQALSLTPPKSTEPEKKKEKTPPPVTTKVESNSTSATTSPGTRLRSKYDFPPVYSHPGAVSLIQAFQKVLHTNPNILESEASQRASKQGVREARAGYFPAVDVSYGAGYDYSKPPGGPPTGFF